VFQFADAINQVSGKRAERPFSTPIIQGLAYKNAVASWKQIIAGIELRIAGQRELQKHVTEDLSISVRLLEAEKVVYRTAIEQAEKRLQELQG
jgi:hypothetical protein